MCWSRQHKAHPFRPPGGNFHHSELQDRVHRFFAHLIPSHTVDTICRITGHKPFLVRLINKMHRGMAPLEWFASRQWIWANDNVVALSEELNTTDREWFHCRVDNLDWHEYWFNYVYTLRKHMLKYKDDTLDASGVRLKRIVVVFGLITGIVSFALVFFAVSCVSSLFF